MHKGIQFLRSSSLLTVSEAVNNVCVLLRSMILAHILSPADFGIALSLQLLLNVFELVGRMSFGQQVVQSKRGAEEKFIANAHACSALGGFISAVLIGLFSLPLAHLFHLSEHRGTMFALMILPLCAGFANLDLYRMSRQLHFVPLLLSESVPQVLMTIAAAPVALWLGDYRALVLLLIAKGVITMAASHYFAERSYHIRFYKEHTRESLKFGWPLLVSSFLMFGVLNGDRMLVAGGYSAAQMGIYSIAAQLATLPCFLIFKLNGTVILPVIAQVKEDAVKFREHYRTLSEGFALTGTLFVVFMAMGGTLVIGFLFGQKYAAAAELTSWMALAQAYRMLRGGTNCAALAQGDSVNTAFSNVLRFLGLALAVPCVLLKVDLVWIAICGVLGEIVALVFSIEMSRKRQGIPYMDTVLPAVVLTLTVLGAQALTHFLHVTNPFAGALLAVLGCVATIVVFFVAFPKFGHDVRELLLELKKKAKQFLNRRRPPPPMTVNAAAAVDSVGAPSQSD